jgi:hypothetical protein
VHVFFELLEDLVVEVEGVRKQSVQPSYDCVETLRLANRDSALKMFDVQQDGGSLIQVVDHIVYCRTIVCCLMCST